MVVAGFRRSLSFPNNPNRSSKPPKSTYHVRSTSLPCRSHPLISQLKDDINGLKSWAASKSDNRSTTSAWLCDGLSRLRTVHESLEYFLSLPQTYESLHHQFTFVEKLLEDFLGYIDVYGIFQTIILSLKQDSSAVQMAIRRSRKNDSKITLYVKSLKKMSKDMSKLISTVQSIGRASNGDHINDELAEVVRDVNEVTVLVSTALFNGISSSSSSINNGCRSTSKSSWMTLIMGLKLSKEAKKRSVLKIEDIDQCSCNIEEFQQVGFERLLGLRKKGDEEVRMVLKRMQNLEDSISEIESCSERVFRSLINTRVSLLNVLTR